MASKSKKTASLSRAAYPACVLFEERNDTYWLRGSDLARARKAIKLEGDGNVIGLDSEMLSIYARHLSEKGLKVGLLRANGFQTIQLHRQESPCKVASRTIGIAPELLVGQKGIECLTRVAARENSPLSLLTEKIRGQLISGNNDSLSEWGKLYVYQVAEDMYEVDEELTSMPKEVREALLVVAHEKGRMLKCQLVLPKPRRRRNGNSAKPVLAVSKPIIFGQLRLPI